MQNETKICKIDGCNNKVLAKQLCRKHYLYNRRNNNIKKCKIENCNNSVIAQELCTKHYSQYAKKGYIQSRTRYDNNNITVNTDNNIAYIDIYDVKGNVICQALIDIEDVEKIKNKKWKSRNNAYIYNSKNSISLSELILKKNQRGYVIVHKNNDMLDYRKENLIVTKTNRRNINFKHNTSGRKGVYKLNNNGIFTGEYLVYINFNGKSKYLGKRDNFKDAVKLREEAERKLGWLET